RTRSAGRVNSARRALSARAEARWLRMRGEGASVRWPDVVDEVLASGARTVTVDVFDTVLVRQVVGQPNERWVVGEALQRAGLWEGSVELFVAARAEAAVDGPLEEIYAQPALAARA